jgi:hypothetical protein
MNWGEHVLRSDPALPLTVRQLVIVVARYFANTAAGYAAFYDYEPAGLIGVSGGQIRAARLELEERNFLRPLHHPSGKPRYRLHFGYVASADDGEAA